MWITISISALVLLLICLFILQSFYRPYDEEILWDWKNIDTSTLLSMPVPSDFQWGAATAAHQVEGGITDNNWTWWENQQDKAGNPRIHNGQKVGLASDHFNKYTEDFGRMKSELGLNAYRFSVEWSRIEPSKGVINQDAIDHYSKKLDHLLSLGITPMITLHHFTHPMWFEELGSFEKEENIPHFVDFSTRLFRAYGDRVQLWATHNEMAPFATMGWGLGAFPPGKNSAQLICDVLGNLLRSHTQVYKAIKALPNGSNSQIGLVKNIFQFDPWNRLNPIDTILAGMIDQLYNEGIIEALKSGTVNFSFPPLGKRCFELPDLPNCIDYIGLNYYSNLLITPKRFLNQKKAFIREGQVATDFPYSIYAEGFYRAIKRISTVNKPIYITENGIPDLGDDRRKIWIERYLYAMKKAMSEGIDVRGYYYWTLMDNFEWAEGYDMRFGLYEVDFETQNRTLRDSAKLYADIIKNSQS